MFQIHGVILLTAACNLRIFREALMASQLDHPGKIVMDIWDYYSPVGIAFRDVSSVVWYFECYGALKYDLR